MPDIYEPYNSMDSLYPMDCSDSRIATQLIKEKKLRRLRRKRSRQRELG